jgi:hypothetical protein
MRKNNENVTLNKREEEREQRTNGESKEQEEEKVKKKRKFCTCKRLLEPVAFGKYYIALIQQIILIILKVCVLYYHF